MSNRTTLNQTYSKRKLLLLAIVFPLLQSCNKEGEPEALDNVRPIKSITLADKSEVLDERRFSAIVQTQDSTILSFESSGKIIELNVSLGDYVNKDQVLAVLDDEPFHLKVEFAKADFRKAEANYKNAAANYKRRQDLSESGHISTSELDQARTDRSSQKSLVDLAKTKLEIAERDLRKTALVAPFYGYISKLLVNQFEEVASGQGLIQLDALDQLQVESLLPENIIGQLEHGDIARISFPGLDENLAVGKVTEIGTLAESANAFSVSLSLSEKPEGLLPGMTAEVIFKLSNSGSAASEGFLLPPTALVGGVNTGKGKHFVFIYNPETQVVNKRAVTVQGGQANQPRIIDGLKAGDIVAVAGVSFLTDGLKVRLLK